MELQAHLLEMHGRDRGSPMVGLWQEGFLEGTSIVTWAVLPDVEGLWSGPMSYLLLPWLLLADGIAVSTS